MKRYLLIVLLIISVNVLAFSQQDKLFSSTCSCFESLAEEEYDKIDFLLDYEYCLREYYQKSVSLVSTDSVDALSSALQAKLETQCEGYTKCQDLLTKMTRKKSRSTIKNAAICRIMRTGEFEDPFDIGNEKIVVSMKDSIQVVSFGKSGLYTKSKVIWKDDCTYSLILIESTNPFENSIFKRGIERTFRIIEIRNGKDVIYETQSNGRWYLGRLRKL